MDNSTQLRFSKVIAGYPKPKFTFFWKSDSPFSQWYLCSFTVDAVQYNCAEQYMMHQKAVLFQDLEMAEKIVATTSPKIQKSLGRKVRNFDDNIWREKCLDIVKSGNILKISQNPDLKQKLFDTKGTILVEASPADQTWGIGLGAQHQLANDMSTWRGQNFLGFILTELRDALQNS